MRGVGTQGKLVVKGAMLVAVMRVELCDDVMVG